MSTGQSLRTLTCLQSLVPRLKMCRYHFYDTTGEPSSLRNHCSDWQSCNCPSTQWPPSSNSGDRYLPACQRVIVVVSRSKVGPSNHCVDMVRDFSRVHDRIETSSNEWVDVTDHPKASLLVVHLWDNLIRGWLDLHVFSEAKSPHRGNRQSHWISDEHGMSFCFVFVVDWAYRWIFQRS